MIYVGIDYSMTCPAICLFRGEDITDVNNFKFHYLAPNKKYEGSFENGLITGWVKPTYSTQEERFDKISDWVLSCVTKFCDLKVGLNEPMTVIIEGYSMGSKGQVFHIAENTGLLKHKLYKKGISFEVPAPTTIKKFATGKGNSKKERMYECFEQKTGWDLESLLGGSRNNNPISDIVDSYFMCIYGLTL